MRDIVCALSDLVLAKINSSRSPEDLYRIGVTKAASVKVWNGIRGKLVRFGKGKGMRYE